VLAASLSCAMAGSPRSARQTVDTCASPSAARASFARRACTARSNAGASDTSDVVKPPSRRRPCCHAWARRRFCWVDTANHAAYRTAAAQARELSTPTRTWPLTSVWPSRSGERAWPRELDPARAESRMTDRPVTGEPAIGAPVMPSLPVAAPAQIKRVASAQSARARSRRRRCGHAPRPGGHSDNEEEQQGRHAEPVRTLLASRPSRISTAAAAITAPGSAT
jgi:hypothetical protein